VLPVQFHRGGFSRFRLLFGGFFGIPATKTISTQKKCPQCGSVYADIAKSGKVGCPVCYEIFGEELARTIRSIHGTTSHTGSVPAKHRALQARAEQLKKLKRELQDAVAREDYEAAAKLRDEIRQIETEKEKEEH
jgi:protein arginine kinase activator